MDWDEDLFSDGSGFPNGEDSEMGSEKEIITRTRKTEEEIEALSTADSLSEYERVLYILNNGNDIQKAAVIKNSCPGLIKDHISDGRNILIPLIIESAKHSEDSNLLSNCVDMFSGIPSSFHAFLLLIDTVVLLIYTLQAFPMHILEGIVY